MNDGMLRQLGRRVAMIGRVRSPGTAMPAAFKTTVSDATGGER